MKIAYLANRLTEVGATFIRHEMTAVTHAGHVVLPFSVRTPGEEDRALSEPSMPAPTTYLLARSRLVPEVLAETITRPAAVLRAARLVTSTSAAGVYGRARSVIQLIAGIRLGRQLRSQGVDHLHNHGVHSAPVAMVASTVACVPYSFTTHGPPEFDSPEQPHLEVHAQQAAFIAAVTHVVRGEVCRMIPMSFWDRVHVVRCGLPAEQLHQAAAEVPDVPVVVCVARLDERKGQQLLLSAAHGLLAEGQQISVVLVGDGPTRDELQRWVERHDMTDHVRFTGWLASHDVRRELVLARGLVLPSLAEGLPLAVMEALAAGRPVVATAVGAVAELVRPGETGWLVPPTDVDALSTALQHLLHSPTRDLTAMGVRGAELVRERHDATREAHTLLGHVERLRKG